MPHALDHQIGRAGEHVTPIAGDTLFSETRRTPSRHECANALDDQIGQRGSM